jgi:hypothetical protein
MAAAMRVVRGKGVYQHREGSAGILKQKGFAPAFDHTVSYLGNLKHGINRARDAHQPPRDSRNAAN